jgi:hypothetical protein
MVAYTFSMVMCFDNLTILIYVRQLALNHIFNMDASVTPWSLYFVFLLYVWVGQGVTWVYMLFFVLGFVVFGIAAD